MADPFVAEIRLFPFNFAPSGWAFCDGQLMPISQNTALFSLLGTTYGGDGKTTFGLPDLRGRAPMQPGQGQGLSLRHLGEMGGAETVTLLASEIPSHSHTILCNNGLSNSRTPGPTVSIARTGGGLVYEAAGNQTAMAAQALTPAGGSTPHTNMQPYLTVNSCIALQGVFPPRS